MDSEFIDLTNQPQVVVVGGEQSPAAPVTSGVPEDSRYPAVYNFY